MKIAFELFFFFFNQKITEPAIARIVGYDRSAEEIPQIHDHDSTFIINFEKSLYRPYLWFKQLKLYTIKKKHRNCQKQQHKQKNFSHKIQKKLDLIHLKIAKKSSLYITKKNYNKIKTCVSNLRLPSMGKRCDCWLDEVQMRQPQPGHWPQ